MNDFAKIQQKIYDLSYEELFLLDELISTQKLKKKQEIYSKVAEQVNECPHCHSKKYTKWGKYKTKIRYKCNSCKRTFTATTGTALHYLKKPNVYLNYITVMFSEGFNSLESEAKRIGISKTTAFSWRHRTLIALGSEAPFFNGFTEIDDIWFRYSQKGRKGLKYSRTRGRSSHKGDSNFQAKLLITKEREAALDMSVVKIGRLSSDDISNKLSGKFSEHSTLISDKHPSIKKFAKSENVNYESFIAKSHVKEKKYHVQTVNYIAGALKNGINHRLRGVSTKYLQNYATLFSVREKYKQNKNKVKNIIIDCFSNIKAWDMNTNIEKIYEQFILNNSKRTYRCPTNASWKSQNWNLQNAKLGVFI